MFFVCLLVYVSSCNREVIEYGKQTELYFSPTDDLTQEFFDFIDSANSTLYCALYDISKDVKERLIRKSLSADVRLIIEDENQIIEGSAVRIDGDGLMHNKFCIKDKNIVWTGSYNPTSRGGLNNNNVLIFYSKHIANLYNNEFFEMWDGNFKTGKRTKKNKIVLNNISYEILFCPEDDCADKVFNELFAAKESIYFMTFSFTRKDIADLLIEKSKQGVIVNGLFESKRVNQEFNKYKYLLDAKQEYGIKDLDNLNFHLDKNKYTMHHKAFVIDNKTIITGSWNPTNAANERNDENIVIIRDKGFASEYMSAYNALAN